MDASPLPDDARQRIDQLLAWLDDAVPDVVAGLHVVGSLALGDYHPGHSDIDLIVVTRHPLGEADVPAVDAVHQQDRRHQQDRSSANGGDLQASYLTTSSLATNPDSLVPSVSHVKGTTTYGTDFEVNPVTWRNLVRHAVAVRGTPTSVWMRDPRDAEIAAFCRTNLADYWQPMVEQILAAADDPANADRTVEAETLERVALGPRRLAETIETGNIISKTAAGEQMVARADSGERPAFEAALAIRRGEIAPSEPIAFADLAAAARSLQRLVFTAD